VKLNSTIFNDEVVVISPVAFLPLKAADSTIMGQSCRIAVWLSKMQAEKSLTLHWRSLLGGSSDNFTGIVAYKGGQYYDYGCMPLHSSWIVQDA